MFPVPREVPGIPPEVVQALGPAMPELLTEILANGRLPDIDELRRTNPSLFRKLEAALSGPLGSLPPEPRGRRRR